MPAAGEGARHLAGPASEIEHGGLRGQAAQRFGRAGLQPAPRLRERPGEGLIEFAVDLQQPFGDRCVHAQSIRPMTRDQTWTEDRRYPPDVMMRARRILEAVRDGVPVLQAVRQHPMPDGHCLGKHALVRAYRQLTESGAWPEDPTLLRRIRMKPVRTLSGVATVTVLTEPSGCPGACLFCPTEPGMPKSYLPDEPGARRAVQHGFDPFAQTASRLEALHAIGHSTDKVELLILGGSWTAYPAEYRRWFVQRCLDALNGFDSTSLDEAQQANAGALHRNVGLVIETRPDGISPDEVRALRALGVTKVQLGAQSLDDRVLGLNQRGHTAEDTRRALRQLRAAGFKIVLHWMPNLLGATPDSDLQDFARLWSDVDLRPDEIKIYPCQLLASAGLEAYWRRGQYEPYSTEQLVCLLADLKPTIPRYCRVNRVVRDIPSGNVVAGNRRTSLRMDAQAELARRGLRCECIRCREVREHTLRAGQLRLDDLAYPAGAAEEHFLSFVTPEDRLAAYLRLSLPGPEAPPVELCDLDSAALVRELHVYGESLALGVEDADAVQHAGLGRQLMREAEAMAARAGYPRLAVIAALGTRGYYTRLGYTLGETYMVKDLPTGVRGQTARWDSDTRPDEGGRGRDPE
jgi:elongator complex protein 3